ncbi:hypothetical protein, partial [Roseateles sp. P5_E7]
ALLRPDHGLLPGASTPESVTHVLAHPLPMSPVYTRRQKKVTKEEALNPHSSGLTGLAMDRAQTRPAALSLLSL